MIRIGDATPRQWRLSTLRAMRLTFPCSPPSEVPLVASSCPVPTPNQPQIPTTRDLDPESCLVCYVVSSSPRGPFSEDIEDGQDQHTVPGGCNFRCGTRMDMNDDVRHKSPQAKARLWQGGNRCAWLWNWHFFTPQRNTALMKLILSTFFHCAHLS